jgi:hypothetical protein
LGAITNTTKPRLEEGVNHGAIAALDADLADTGAVQHPDELAQAGLRVRHRRSPQLHALLVDNGDRVLSAGPVDPGCHPLAGQIARARIGQWGWTRGVNVVDTHGVPSLLVMQQVGTRWSRGAKPVAH